jgi:hypothetical protein
VKLREIERKTAIAQGTMDDPLVPKRLEDAISMVGTCADMCPRFERYRRERENNLFEWETVCPPRYCLYYMVLILEPDTWNEASRPLTRRKDVRARSRRQNPTF